MGEEQVCSHHECTRWAAASRRQFVSRHEWNYTSMLSQRWGTIISLTHSLANSYSLIPSYRKTYSLAIQVAIGPFNVQILGIFRYLDRLICEVVKPTKLLFIGVDGTHLLVLLLIYLLITLLICLLRLCTKSKIKPATITTIPSHHELK